MSAPVASTPVERLLFYERQYLRSYDWIAEQNYHLEMRRRLNRLHLWGIVDGLELLKVEGPEEQFYISPGMAIDGYGREILVFAPYVLSEEDLRANRINAIGTYPIWLAYAREPSRPPAAGYRICDVKDQYTRWRESFEVVISKEGGPDPKALPKPSDPVSDDPTKSPWRVRLGAVVVDTGANSLFIKDIQVDGRVYIGLRAQRVVPAVVSDATKPSQERKPIDVDANLLVKQDLILGKDFDIDSSKILPAPPAGVTLPALTGNARVASDIYLLGDLYKKVADDWLGLPELIKRSMPDIQVKSLEIEPTVGVAEMANGTETINIVSKLPKVDSATMMVALSGITWRSVDDLLDWLGDVNTGAPLSIRVDLASATKKAGTDNSFDFDIAWSVGPKSTPVNPNDALLHIAKFVVNCVAVFYP